MKRNTIILTFCLVTLYSIAEESHDLQNLPQLDSNTEKALKREALVTIDPNGQINLDTQGGFLNTTLSRIGKDGEIETYCTSNSVDARRFLAGVPLDKIKGELK